MASCVGYLHKLRDDFGITKKDLEEQIKEATRPREVPLPTFHTKKSVLRERRAAIEAVPKPGSKKMKYKLAYWYLEEYLDKAHSDRVYREHLKFKELINYAYTQAVQLIQFWTMFKNPTPKEWVESTFPEPIKQYDEEEIPDHLWKEYDKFLKKHPIRDLEDMFRRRRQFNKKRRKRNKKLYSKKRMRIYDPFYVPPEEEAKKMIKRVRMISKENELRIQEFHKFLDQLVGNRALGSEDMKKFKAHTEKVMKRVHERLFEFKRSNRLAPSPNENLEISIVDGSELIRSNRR